VIQGPNELAPPGGRCRLNSTGVLADQLRSPRSIEQQQQEQWERRQRRRQRQRTCPALSARFYQPVLPGDWGL